MVSLGVPDPAVCSLQLTFLALGDSFEIKRMPDAVHMAVPVSDGGR